MKSLKNCFLANHEKNAIPITLTLLQYYAAKQLQKQPKQTAKEFQLILNEMI